MSSAIPSILMAIYQLGGNAADYYWQFTFVIALVTTLALLSLFVVLIQTRLYFIYPARQVNSIRRHHLKKIEGEKFENQMYLNTTFSAFKWRSSQTLLNVFIAAQMGVFAGLTIYSYLKLTGVQDCIVSLSAGTGIICTLLAFALSASYLFQSSKYHPDKSIHRESVR
tara:strand:+ start:1752 stop:2255 length:504 start_codon:yes stop_codon:yes gene_type:complete